MATEQVGVCNSGITTYLDSDSNICVSDQSFVDIFIRNVENIFFPHYSSAG